MRDISSYSTTIFIFCLFLWNSLLTLHYWPRPNRSLFKPLKEWKNSSSNSSSSSHMRENLFFLFFLAATLFLSIYYWKNSVWFCLTEWCEKESSAFSILHPRIPHRFLLSIWPTSFRKSTENRKDICIGTHEMKEWN